MGQFLDTIPGTVNIFCVNSHDKVSLTTVLIQVNPKDLILGQGHLVK